jgi:hypothetical protein
MPGKSLPALALAVALLSGCSNTITAVSPPPQPIPVNTTLTNAQQADEANAAMTATNGIRIASLFAALFDIKGNIVRAPAVRRGLTCKDGVESSVTFPTPENIDVVVDVFYDKACVKRFIASKFTAAVHLPDTIVLAGSQTTYDAKGKPVGFGTIVGISHPNSTGNTTTLAGNLGQTGSAPAILTFGLSCSISTATGNDCGFGAINDFASATESFGMSAKIDGFVGSGETSNANIHFAAYTGKKESLNLSPGPGLSWAVSGGKTVLEESGPFHERVDASTFAIDLDLNLKNASSDAGSLTKLSNNTMTGTVVQPNVHLDVASFTTAPDGKGSMYYFDHSVGTIASFLVL